MAYPNNGERKSKLIAVTGPTGAGKTSFINAVCGSNLKVGTSLQSCTDKVQTAHCEFGGERVTLIDTPGFDDTHKSQADILKDIADFLEQTYEKGRKLSGVIYLHRISDYRVGGIARENFRLFSKICGKDAMKNVLIMTTMWEEVREEVGVRREQELKSKRIFFEEAISQGARMGRLYSTTISATGTLTPFLEYYPKPLQMQCELVDEQKLLPQTSAGTELQSELDRQAEKHRVKLSKLQAEMGEVMAQREASHEEEMDELKRSLAHLGEKLTRLEGEMRKLAVESPSREERRMRRGFRGRVREAISRLQGRRDRKAGAMIVEKSRQGGGCLDDDGFEL